MEENSWLHIKCKLDPEIINETQIMNVLPEWKTIVTVAEIIKEELPKMHLKILIAATTIEEILQWVKEFEAKTKTIFTIKSTEKCSGRYVTFKQRRYCRHNTNCKRTYAPALKRNTRNTNCPCKMTITLRAIKARSRYKDINNLPNPQFPCTIDMVATHNHSVDSPDMLRFHPVSDDVKQILMGLYKCGHTPATALQTIKMDLHLKYPDYDKILADRTYCPDYHSCYYIYKKTFKDGGGQLDTDDKGQTFLAKSIADINVKTKDSAKMVLAGNDYVICLCPPLIKRVHMYAESSEILVYLDSTGTVGLDGYRIYTLLTPSACGGLPLGIIITSSDCTNLLITGLELLKSIMGDSIFYGNVDGPRIFLTDNNAAQKTAINSVWPNSSTFWCRFRILENVLKWLVDEKNSIPEEKQISFFQEFTMILYAPTIKECFDKYEITRINAEAYSNYYTYFMDYWAQKELWAMCFRKTGDYSETAMRLLKAKIFQRVKAFNVVQMVHFLNTKFIHYYEVRLGDAAQNRLSKNILSKPMKHPPAGIKNRMECLSNNMVLVPSEKEIDSFYIVNTDVLLCTCLNGSLGYICKHIDWACCLLFAEKSINVHARKMFSQIARIKEEPLEVSLPGNDVKIIMELPDVTDFSTNSMSDMDVKHQADEDEEDDDDEVEEELINKGQQVINEIADLLKVFLEQSPGEVLPALTIMKEKLHALETVSGVVSACSTFGEDIPATEIAADETTVDNPRKRLRTETYTLVNTVATKNGTSVLKYVQQNCEQI